MASKYAKVLKELEPRKNEASILDNLSPQLADIGSPVLDSIASAKDSSDIVKAEAAPIVSAANKSIEVSPARAILSQLDEKQIEAKKAGRADVAAEIQIEKARIADSQVSKINPPASAAMQSLKHKYLALIARFTDIVAAIVGAPSVMQQINPHSKSQRQAHDALMSAEQTHQRVQQLAKSINSHLQKLKAIALTTLDQCQMQIKLSASPKSRSLAEICCNSAQLILQEIDRAIVFLNKCCAAASKQAHNSVQPSALVHPSKISATSKQAALAPSEINKKFNQSAQAISINLDSVQKNLEQAKIDDQKRQAAIDAARGRASQINRR
jgi:hypothetical protein